MPSEVIAKLNSNRSSRILKKLIIKHRNTVESYNKTSNQVVKLPELKGWMWKVNKLNICGIFLIYENMNHLYICIAISKRIKVMAKEIFCGQTYSYVMVKKGNGYNKPIGCEGTIKISKFNDIIND